MIGVTVDAAGRGSWVSRMNWPPGPWHHEPDRVEWRHLGLPCLVVRSGSTGGLCGYVGVTRGHPWFGVDFADLEIRTHGGLTYSSFCSGPICHVPQPGEADEVWWVGFDTSHLGDETPRDATFNSRMCWPRRGVYRDLAYVRAEVERLAEQAEEVTP